MASSKTQFGYRRHPDQDRAAADVAEYPVVVVGAGPVGLSLAIDLAQRGQSVVLLDDADRIGEGSRAICFSKRSLEYWDRLGIVEQHHRLLALRQINRQRKPHRPGADHHDRIFGHIGTRPILIGMPAIAELGFAGRHAG
jgi:2-polyprenyl-6-methoxyphenol hydroxylase-like FAD-dependent oxidoreductase